MKNILLLVLMAIFGISLVIGMWYFARKWNYNLSYKAMVQETVREMIRESALKNK